jgi:hypothetical protein
MHEVGFLLELFISSFRGFFGGGEGASEEVSGTPHARSIHKMRNPAK